MKQKFLAISAYGKLSLLELAGLRDSKNFDFEISRCAENSAIVEVDENDGKSFAKRLGGFYKIVKICGESVDELLHNLPLPEEPKFNWTISCYDCGSDAQEETRSEVSDFLKSNSLGKSRFLKPAGEFKNNLAQDGTSELKLRDLAKNVLSKSDNRVEGLDVVVHCGYGKKLYGYTEYISDVSGFERRDFARSYQDPTTTVGPRIARVLVNLCSLQSGSTLLDPFCGLGTILQESMMCGYNSVGVDISQANVRKCFSNLEWFRSEFRISPKLWYRVIRADSTELVADDIPPVHGIATEPLLVPKFETNPTSMKAEEILRDVRMKYQELIRAFARLIRSNQKAVVVAPEIVDDRGKLHTIRVEELMESDLSLYRPGIPDLEAENPCRVPTAKKKTVQRKIYVMERR